MVNKIASVYQNILNDRQRTREKRIHTMDMDTMSTRSTQGGIVAAPHTHAERTDAANESVSDGPAAHCTRAAPHRPAAAAAARDVVSIQSQTAATITFSNGTTSAGERLRTSIENGGGEAERVRRRGRGTNARDDGITVRSDACTRVLWQGRQEAGAALTRARAAELLRLAAARVSNQQAAVIGDQDLLDLLLLLLIHVCGQRRTDGGRHETAPRKAPSSATQCPHR